MSSSSSSAPPQGILSFVRGVDLSSNPLDDDFGSRLKNLNNLYWVKLNKTGLEHIPPTVVSLPKLENISVSRNNLKELSDDLSELKRLQSIVARRNKLTMRGLPGSIFTLEDLSTVDLSWNDLADLPPDAAEAKSLRVLSLAHNRLTAIPSQLLVNCPDIQFLDVSHNKVDNIPPQLRRLAHLEVLNLSYNPLEHVSLRSLCALSTLAVLNLSATQRNLQNIPDVLDQLTNLIELDLSYNNLPGIPVVLFNISSLRRLNLANNHIADLTPLIGQLENLQTLNVSNNKLTAIPEALFDIKPMRRLYLNRNSLTRLPDKFDAWTEFEVLHVAHNRITDFPGSLCACTKLHRLKLNDNQIPTVPASIYKLEHQLKLFNVEDNEDFSMPPRPKGGSYDDTYNIDFTAQIAQGEGKQGVSVLYSRDISVQTKKAVARQGSLKRIASKTPEKGREEDTAKVLEGMKKVSADKSNRASSPSSSSSFAGQDDVADAVEPKKPKRWDELIEKPKLDYSELFGNSVGKREGVTVWRIENFLPIESEPDMVGKFYEADCYVVLKSVKNDQGAPEHTIWFWIGEKATLDKKASAAIHAVNLRNHIGAGAMAMREEQNDESADFLHLFNNEIAYIEGGTESGFFIVEPEEYVIRLYRVTGEKSIHVEPLALSVASLHSHHVYMLDAGLHMIVWCGKDSKLTQRSKTRLLAEKINKNERGNRAEVRVCNQDEEPIEFWKFLLHPSEYPSYSAHHKAHHHHHNGAQAAAAAPKTPVTPPPKGSISSDPALAKVTHRRSCLYKVALGKGFLELPQVDTFSSNGNLLQSMLESNHVFILDCHVDVFIWIGRKSSRLVRAAALKLSEELMHILPRPSHAIAIKTLELAEVQLFKSNFVGWDDAIDVDFSSLNILPPVLTVKQKQERTKAKIERPTLAYTPPKVDLSALFTSRPHGLSDDQADAFMADANDRLEKMECFVLEGRKFVRLPKKEVGQFYDHDCYVFLCTYWKDKEFVFHDEGSESDGDGPENENEDEDEDENENEEGEGDESDSGDGKAEDADADEAASSSGGSKKKKGKNESPEAAGKDDGSGKPAAAATNGAKSSSGKSDSDGEGDEDNDDEEEEEDEIECVVYFWQGRYASQMGWLTFSFSFQKEIEKLIENMGSDLRVVRTFQQRESLTFLSHFMQRMIIHHGRRPTKAEQAAAAAAAAALKGGRKGSSTSLTPAASPVATPVPTRPPPKAEVLLYHIRQNASKITTRTVCVKPTALSLCSQHCFILKVPFDNTKSGIIYVWIGKKASPAYVKLAEAIGQTIKGDSSYSFQIIQEGNEPENFFWVALGGKAAYDDSADFLQRTRLFVCSNAQGFFSITEKNPDFCQDDLTDDDVMILDAASDVFLWFGTNASEVEKKLAIKSAQVYLERMKDGRSVKNLKLAKRGKEPRQFTRCFHGWDENHIIKSSSSDGQ